jgi:hypothetical protein
MQTTVALLNSRIRQIRRDLELYERALEALKARVPARGAGAVGPDGTFSLSREGVARFVRRNPLTTREIIEAIAADGKHALTSELTRVMWARAHQHLLVLEKRGVVARRGKAWVLAGRAKA